MNKPASRLAAGRLSGEHQVDAQRARILDAAEKLFLQRGLEKTRMIDIAAEAGIIKITLYRYFSNRDEIALALHERMLGRIAALFGPEDRQVSPEMLKRWTQIMIRNFEPLRDAYRYIGLFDSLYLDNPPGTSLTEWVKKQLVEFSFSGELDQDLTREFMFNSRFAVILNNVIWFLEKLALRGELTWSDPSIPLAVHLQTFEELTLSYIDSQYR